MANADVIQKALDAAELADFEFQTFIRVMREVSGDDCPDWVVLVDSTYRPLSRALEQLGYDLRAQRAQQVSARETA